MELKLEKCIPVGYSPFGSNRTFMELKHSYICDNETKTGF